VVAATRMARIVACSYVRAELTSLANAYMSQMEDQLSGELRSFDQNVQRARRLEHAIRVGEFAADPFSKDGHNAGYRRMCSLLARPTATLERVTGQLEDGFRRLLTRPSDDGVGPCVDVRARTLNEAAADVAIDIHADGGPSTGRGFTILRPVPSGVNDGVVTASLKYADFLKSAMLKTGMPVSDCYGANGFKDRDDLAGLNLTTVPQLLLETGNMRNQEDADLLTSDRFQRDVAQAILEAMVAFLADTPSTSGHP
jgi:hypothetical protein